MIIKKLVCALDGTQYILEEEQTDDWLPADETATTETKTQTEKAE